MSHYYAGRIANIPLPPPIPPPILAPHHVDGDLGAVSPDHVDGYGYGVDPGDFGLNAAGHFGHGMEDAARVLEDSILGGFRGRAGPRNKGKGSKRPASGAVSDASSDLNIPTKKERPGPPNKKRKIAKSVLDITDDLERSIGGDYLSASVPSKLLGPSTKGKGKQRELSHDSFSMTPKPTRKRAGPRKKLGPDLEILGLGSGPGSAAGDVTPALSRPTSPVPTVSTIVYELDEPIPPLKRAKKIDDHAMLKRIKSLEETQRKVWTNIARRDVAKVRCPAAHSVSQNSYFIQVYKYHAMGYQSRQSQAERIAKLASIQARRPFTKTAKANKDIQAKAKRLMREMQVFWKKNEREERDVRKREQKEALDRAKIEEEQREVARQARKLEFLISQTELYSHFVGSKLKSASARLALH